MKNLIKNFELAKKAMEPFNNLSVGEMIPIMSMIGEEYCKKNEIRYLEFISTMYELAKEVNEQLGEY